MSQREEQSFNIETSLSYSNFSTYDSLDTCINDSLDIDESYTMFSRKDLSSKKTDALKNNNAVPLTFGKVNTRLGKPKLASMRVLLDSGGSSTVIRKEYVENCGYTNVPTYNGVLWQGLCGPLRGPKYSFPYQSSMRIGLSRVMSTYQIRYTPTI